MHANLKRGLTRLYVLFWALWALILCSQVAAQPALVRSALVLPLFVQALVLPALFLAGFRWMLAGFFPEERR